MTLLECISNAKAVSQNYVAPNKEMDKYTIDEITNLAVSEVLKNEILTYCSIIIAKQNTIVKALYKGALKDFISTYGKKNV